MRVLVTGGSGFIGTNLVENLLGDGVEVLNLDAARPFRPEHDVCWRPCDILDATALKEALARFAPTHVLHLAARTDCNERETVDGYQANTAGTRNVLDAVAGAKSVARLIVTSTQFVCRPGHLPGHDEDYSPHTVYGQSKVICEQLTRQAKLDCPWTIVRPTTIWGPWLFRHRNTLFPLLCRGLYLHPGRQPCIRCWGYVGNVVAQFRRLLEVPAERIDHRTYYLGDRPRNLLDWVNGFSLRLRGKPVRIVPRSAVYLLGLAGDAVALAGVRAPITTSRYRSMTEDYVTPIEPTFALLGEPPFSLEEGIEQVVQWLNQPCPRPVSGVGKQ